ncbi:hypothetical protein NW759_008363 [Fusarium solani]|nr:hypothetical protein NW759_008363 [Fusarium solani]
MAESGGVMNRLKAALEGAGLKKATLDESPEYKNFVTVRDLAGLFEGICPATPNFLLAYKQRVEEIYGSTAPGTLNGYTLSIRVALRHMTDAGLPYPSLGGAVVHLHLLACIIALGSDAEEATSTWESIVAFRTLDQAELRGDITRSRLATWDSSARAWIELGDKCMSKEKNQLESLLQQVELAPWKMFPIIAESYTGTQRVSALINVWLSALTIMENLTLGRRQEVQDGEVLRVLPAFHLYPDVYAFGSRNVEAHMHDALVPPRGVLTVDFGPGAKATSNEIFRSLPLPDV